jgi:periplasmic protein CpxP/Spy
MKTLKTIILSTAMLLALGAVAWQSPSGQDNPGKQGRMHRMNVDDRVKMLTEKLNLSEDQQAKAKSILTDSHQQMQAVRNDSSLSQDDRRSKMRSLHEATNSKLRDILNDDQKKTFDDMQQQMREHSNHGKGGNGVA